MKIKWSGIGVTDGRGKLGGTVAGKGRYGAWLRRLVTPSNPNTGAQQAERNFMGLLAQAWRGLLQSQRDLWNSVTTAFQATNIFGDTFNYSGFNLFMRLNRYLLSIGEAQINDAPMPGTVIGMTALSVICDLVTPGSLEVTFTPVTAVTEKLVLRATAPQSPGKTFVKSEFRIIAVLDSTDTSPYEANADYIAKFGALGAEGTKIFIDIRPISVATGQPGTRMPASTIVVDTTV